MSTIRSTSSHGKIQKVLSPAAGVMPGEVKRTCTVAGPKNGIEVHFGSTTVKRPPGTNACTLTAGKVLTVRPKMSVTVATAFPASSVLPVFSSW